MTLKQHNFLLKIIAPTQWSEETLYVHRQVTIQLYNSSSIPTIIPHPPLSLHVVTAMANIKESLQTGYVAL